MNMNSKMKSRLLYLGVTLLLICYLLIANQIVYLFRSTETDLHKVDGVEQFQTTALGYCKVEESEYKGGEMEDFRLYGWAYAEGNEKNLPINGKRVDILLQNLRGKVYQANAAVTIRPDIFYSETEIGHKPISGYTGFEAIFSTLLLPKGTYNVQIFVHENEEVSALLETGIELKKTWSGVFDQSSERIDSISDLRETDEITFALDQFALDENGKLLVRGWGILQDIVYGDVQMLLQIMDSNGVKATYQLTSIERADIQQAFGDQYLNSGFSQVVVLPDKFDLGEMRVRFILKNDGIAYLSAQEIKKDLTVH